MRQWGKRECRTRSGSPWRALGLIRSTKRVHARARVRDVGLRAAGAIVLSALMPCGRACAAAADARFEFPTFDVYLSALPSLERDEIAALALTFGVLCFAVVTAILFVR